MNGYLQQIVALAINGNAVQRGVPIEGFWPGSSAFIFEHETSFHVLRRHWLKREWVKACPDPISWYATNSAGYRLHCRSRNDPNISDRMTSGFANGGPCWQIETVRDGRSSFWEGSMEVSHPDAADRKIWTTRYYRVEDALLSIRSADIELAGVQDQLRSAIETTHAFALRQESGFAELFAKALNELDSGTPSPFGWQGDLLPAGLEIALPARQLLASAQAAYVFGGMGSWNDQYWSVADTEAEYQEVSDQLFSCLLEAVVAATNSTFTIG